MQAYVDLLVYILLVYIYENQKKAKISKRF